MTALGRVLAVHQLLYERSDGRVGHGLLGTPTLLLRTTGRRSGAQRTNALVYLADDGRYVVVASKGGDDKPPGWLLNLIAQPDVEVQVGRDRKTAVARVMQPGEEGYERLWRMVNDNNSGRYDRYQAKTARPIPLVILTPS
jgi:deazaflavin-dependent oxidoreductase (nitroreductase family)